MKRIYFIGFLSILILAACSKNEVLEIDDIDKEIAETEVIEKEETGKEVPEEEIPEQTFPENEIPEQEVPVEEEEVPENEVPEQEVPENEQEQDLKSILNNKQTFLVDVRTPEEFAAGHVEGSVNIPVTTIEQNLDRFRNKKYIAVFCRSGNRSNIAKKILENNGFNNVIDAGTWKNVAGLMEKVD